MLRLPQFRRLFLGQLISLIGDYALLVALPVWVFQRTGSGAAIGGIFIAATLPQLLVSPIAGVFVDRWDRRRTLIVSDLVRAGLVLGLLAAEDQARLWLVYLLVAAQSTVSRFFFPARTAILPSIVPSGQLGQANASLSFSDAAARLCGPALGGVLVAAWSLPAAVLWDALTYLVSSVLLAGIAPAPVSSRVPAGTRYAVRGILSGLRDGIRAVATRRLLRMVLAVGGLLSFAQGVINVVLVLVVARTWNGGAPELGWLTSAQGLGALAGGLAVTAVAAKVAPRVLLAAGALGSGALVLVMANQPSLAIAAALYAVVGVLMVALQVGAGTLLQTGTPDEYRGRVSSLITTSGALASLVAMVLASTVAGTISPVLLVNVAGIVILVAGIAAMGRPVLRRATSTARSPAAG
jgi:MFS family permease